MEDAEVLKISDLIQRARPCTAASSLRSTRRRPITSSPPTEPNPNPKILTPLNSPSILIGTLNLPLPSHHHDSPSLRCSYNNCFQFSDGSASVCCDVLDLDVSIIGKQIHVIAFNFLPLKNRGGFLEIIKWKFPESRTGLIPCSSNLSSFPLVSGSLPTSEDTSKARCRVHGALESVNPVSVVPCTVGGSDLQNIKGLDSSASKNMRGFIVKIMVCQCKLCNSKESVMVLQSSVQKQDSHSLIKPVFVYFCGSVSSWHPVITKFIGCFITLSGLKKKLIYISKEESQLMYVTTGKSVLYMNRLSKKWIPFAKIDVNGKGECGAYTGIVKGVYMHGMVVELDKDVWLLLTDQLLTPPHSLRVGTLISVRNVHFVNPKFSWTKILILGACVKTSIIVESFSPLETRCHIVSQSQSLLGKFIQSLAFSARLWVLLLVSCFRKKFAGSLSEKEIFGTKHFFAKLMWTVARCHQKEGLAQMYASSTIPSPVFQSQHGVFVQVCKHDSSGCGGEILRHRNLKLVSSGPSGVVPISSFIRHCEAAWMTTLLQLKDECQVPCDKNKHSLRSCEQSVRRIFPSEDIGVVLLGSLKISSSSGRLQLVDRTGSLDVVIPDLPSTWSPNSIYEVTDYSVVVEGIPQPEDHLGLLGIGSFSCRSIFHCIPLSTGRHLAIYVFFHLKNLMCGNLSFSSRMDWKDDIKELESGTFHLLRVTHKFPVPWKFQGDSVISNKSSMFIEATVLPWDLFLTGKDRVTQLTKVSKDQLMEPMGCCASISYQEHVSSKRRKTNFSLSRESGLGLNDDFSSAISAEWQSCNLSSSHEVPCLVTLKSGNNHSLVRSGFLCCTDAKDKIRVGCKSRAQKVLLEFQSESFFKYQLLQIGGYYIVKHQRESSFCNLKGSDCISDFKVLIPPNTHLWNLSFSCDEVLANYNSSHDPPLDETSLGNNEILSGDQIELLLHRSTCNSLRTCSDICLHLSTNAMNLLDVTLKEMEEGLIKPVAFPEEDANVFPCIGTMLSASILSSATPDSSCLFPEGNLTTINGDVVAVHSNDRSFINPHSNHETLGDVHHSRLFQGVTSSICICLLVDHKIVRIYGSLSKHAYPIGFGPGVNATFHRILRLSEENGLMLTPVSFILINTIRQVNDPYKKCYKSQSISDTYNFASPNTVSSGLISELIQCLESKPMQFRCRVVAVHIVVLEKKNRKYDDPQSKILSTSPLIDIPLAGFVLDDGSSSCCCWANAERAVKLLRLHEELPKRAFENSSWTRYWVGTDENACNPAIYHLETILKKHDRIMVKNYGSILDSSSQDLTVSVNSDKVLNSSDENILRFITFNACFGSFWNVVGSVMSLDAVGELEKQYLVEMEMTMHSMQNIWAIEVYHTNTLTDARNLIQEVQNSL